MLGKNLILELNTKMPSASYSTGFINFNISKKYQRFEVDFMHAGTYLLRYYATFNFWKTQNLFELYQITSNS